MRWPWRRRPGTRVVFIGTSPFDVAAFVAEANAPAPQVAFVPEQPGTSGIVLGFADGTVMEIPDDDPRAAALRAAAARLTGPA